jgi:hypothetical protein
LLDGASLFKYASYCIPKDDKFGKMTKSQLQEELRQQIRPVNCFLALGGVSLDKP